MVSRKRNQGKARKAAKAKAREEEEQRRNNQATNGPQQSLAVQMQRLQIGNATIAGRVTTKCRHGLQKIDNICAAFVIAFRKAYYGVQNFVSAFEDAYYDAVRGGGTLCDCLVAAHNATEDEYSEVWNNSAKIQLAISFVLNCGAQSILEGYKDNARECAIFARFFEQYAAVELKKTQALINWPKVGELDKANDHTLVKFFRQRIPCSCLDEKYQEVKHITKMGFCYNPQCNIPDRRAERGQTMYCSRCRCAVYCSRECHKADWPRHQEWCDMDVAIIADFEAKKT